RAPVRGALGRDARARAGARRWCRGGGLGGGEPDRAGGSGGTRHADGSEHAADPSRNCHACTVIRSCKAGLESTLEVAGTACERSQVADCSSCVIVAFTVLMSMANPMLLAPSTPAVLIPTTWPSASTRGPPELPGLMAASVCSSPCSVSVSV